MSTSMPFDKTDVNGSLEKLLSLKCISSFLGDKHTPVCNSSRYGCVTEIEEKMVNLTFLERLNKNVDRVEKSCNCMPACTSITYDIELSQANFDYLKLIRSLYALLNMTE